MTSKSNAGRLTSKLREPRTRYTPERRIAVGGMAEIWMGRATTPAGDTYPVAIKRVRPELWSQSVYHSMFQDEAHLGMLLRHPNIVRVYDARHVGGSFIMIMELVDGPSLQSIMAQAQARGAGMPTHVALYIIHEIALALDYAHNAKDAQGSPLNILHRDVSPHNVLLGRDGAIKLLDFGLSNARVHQTQVEDGIAGGKFGYLAPEVIENLPLTPAIDVFAAGIVLWEALAGKRLFQGKDDRETIRNVIRCEVPSVRSVNPSVREEVDHLLTRLLARSPQDRVPHAAALAMDLRALMNRVAPDVGPKDVSLLASLHLASARVHSLPPPEVVKHMAEELETFAIHGNTDPPVATENSQGPLSQALKKHLERN